MDEALDAAWYISSPQHTTITANKAKIRAFLEQVLTVADPTYSPDAPLQALRLELGHCLLFIRDLCGDVVSPVWTKDIFPSASSDSPHCCLQDEALHTMNCFLRFYTSRFQGATPASSPQNQQRPGDCYLAELASHFSQNLVHPCNGNCLAACRTLSADQVEGLLYLCNLVTAYVLASLAESFAAEDHIRSEFRGAWPRIQLLLSTGADTPSAAPPLAYSGVHDTGPWRARL